ncbi:taurine catabolism dioxygenase tauD, tfdA family protein [Hirsutella rhossiliensis]|uniref:Taurine catabolism dioxygenase tauD, tfdA family domain-containing protein n=1 Tax=Hirsutella rhossiliensis TaxID=111463 RepID=A0A9P8MRI9_9HYPO|nr:taurine catabolism dioxygenase tauD, tfdA family domain-containing protein [Hirsutella rhossiliensis]KAH0960928.1 taurine catabolism dioxygenase tauD, tfdA family domain-containing protein [Hirsutella rhossiliensis]
MADYGAGPVVGSHAAALPSITFPAALKETSRLPAAFPPVLNSPLAWSGYQFAEHSEYVLTLDKLAVEEVEQALEQFKALGLDGDLISREIFPLPNLGPRLDRLRVEIHQGRGFGLIRGLDPQKYSVEDLTMLHLGIQSYIANRQGRQDSKGNMLVHIVADSSSAEKAVHHRHSTASITFHNEEAGDIVSWLTRNTAAKGGKCIIASAYTVYNVMAASRPDLVRTLARSDWPFALPRFQCRPVIFYHNERLITNFGRAALLGSAGHGRSKQLPELTRSQLEALDMIESIAKATQLEIPTEPGDIHFINNLAILHRREGFENGQSPHERRHLVRMRLRDDELGWDMPSDLDKEWSKAFNPERVKVWHLEPMPDGFFPLRSQPN